MKRIFIKLTISLMAIGFASSLQLSAQAEIIIYGDDERQEVEDSAYSHLSRYLVAMVDIQDARPMQSYGKRKKLCPEARFYSQPSISKCSGLLIQGRYILTAAHCVSHSSTLQQARNDCRKKGWLLDYQTNNGVSQGQSYTMVKCDELIEFDKKSDYALIKINKPQDDRNYLPPVESQSNFKNGEFFSLGFPSGLPMKSTTGKFIAEGANGHDAFFSFDTFQGSSGSPVFNEAQELIGVLKSGKADFTFNEQRRCFEVNRCDHLGHGCEDKLNDAQPAEGVTLISKIISRSGSNKNFLKKLFNK